MVLTSRGFAVGLGVRDPFSSALAGFRAGQGDVLQGRAQGRADALFGLQQQEADLRLTSLAQANAEFEAGKKLRDINRGIGEKFGSLMLDALAKANQVRESVGLPPEDLAPPAPPVGPDDVEFLQAGAGMPSRASSLTSGSQARVGVGRVDLPPDIVKSLLAQKEARAASGEALREKWMRTAQMRIVADALPDLLGRDVYSSLTDEALQQIAETLIQTGQVEDLLAPLRKTYKPSRLNEPALEPFVGGGGRLGP